MENIHEQTINDCERDLHRIRETILKTEQSQEGAMRELEELKDSLPILLSGQLLGEVTEGEVVEVKEQIAEFKDILADIPIILQGLKDRKPAIQGKISEARKSLDYENNLKRYDFFLKKFQKKAELLKYDRGLEQDLRSTAASVGKRSEANAFIYEATTRRTHRAIVDTV
jgi:hypothetical protein